MLDDIRNLITVIAMFVAILIALMLLGIWIGRQHQADMASDYSSRAGLTHGHESSD